MEARRDEGACYDPPYAVKDHINPETVAFLPLPSPLYFDLFLLSLPWKHFAVTIGSARAGVLFLSLF